MTTTAPSSPDPAIPTNVVDAALAGAVRLRLRPGYVAIRRAKSPSTAGAGLIVIPDAWREEPMEGTVVAVAEGRYYEEHFCEGLARHGYASCGKRATHRLLRPHGVEEWVSEYGDRSRSMIGETEAFLSATDEEHAPRFFVCDDCLQEHHAAVAKKERPVMIQRQLLERRPAEVKVGDRVIFSKWAGAHPTVVLGESLILTDDVLGVIEDPTVGLVTRREAVS